MSMTLYNDSTIQSNSYFLSQSWLGLYSSLSKLSSGFRINSAADNPAGLVISEQLRSQIGSLEQEIENYSDLVGKYQVASSTVSELRTHLTNLRQLAVGASNEALNSPEAQQAYQTAADSLVNTYNNLATNSEFNGKKLLDGSEGSVASVEQLASIDLSSADSAVQAIDTIDAAASGLDGVQTEIGSTQKNEFEARIASLSVTRENLIAAESQLRDTDYVTQYSNFIIDQFKFKAGLALVSHYNISSRGVLELLKSN
ncbi:MAG TPA: flagellin [candidate division Zixibacteria bacterium]|nr:flagellin [candidate division Zixibacteria bacterium]